MTASLPPQYNPALIEHDLYQWWLDRDLWRARLEDRRASYVVMLPPPNVTASLHMGHGLNQAIQDALIRFERMRGRNVLWLPGTDHAGIATQNVVERLVGAERTTWFDLGRDAFVEQVWQYVRATGNTILHQIRGLGSSRLVYEFKAVARAGWETWDEVTKLVLGEEVWKAAKEKWPGGVKTIFMDTCTHMTDRFTYWVMEFQPKKNRQTGEEDTRAPYGVAQDELGFVFTVMENCHPEMHILWGAQLGDNGEDGNNKIRGPQTVGQKGPLILPHRFTFVAHMDRRSDRLTKPKGNVVVNHANEFPKRMSKLTC